MTTKVRRFITHYASLILLPLAFIIGVLAYVQHAEIKGQKQGQAFMCPALLHEQHTLFDSVMVADAWPVCWDEFPLDSSNLLRYRQLELQ